jgi:hypothetical protein
MLSLTSKVKPALKVALTVTVKAIVTLSPSEAMTSN